MPEHEQAPESSRERESTRFGVASEPSADHPERNEDSFFTAPENDVFAVFDGMGGHASGDVASRLAREVLAERLSSWPQLRQPDMVKEWLDETLREIDRVISDRSRTQPQSRGMGAAGSIFVMTRDGGGLVGLAGTSADTRVWVFREHQLKQITIDNYNGQVGSIPDAGTKMEILQRLNAVKDTADLEKLNQFDQYIFNHRNRVDNQLGSSQYRPYLETFDLQPRDRILLSSDGIHDNLTAAEVAAVLDKITNSTEAAMNLVLLSQQRSRSESIRAKPDDMTALVVEIPEK